MPDVPDLPAAALALSRARRLLRILDRAHTYDGLHTAARAAVYEVETAQKALCAVEPPPVGADPNVVAVGPPGLSGPAARARQTRPGSNRHMILRYLAARPGASDWQIQKALEMAAGTEVCRRTELTAIGWVERARDADGEQVRAYNPDTTHSAWVWRITDLGRRALSGLEAGQMVLALVGEVERIGHGPATA